MPDDWNNLRDRQLVETMLDRLDVLELSAKLHERGRTELREQDVRTIARLVALSALKTPGKIVAVAGLAAHVADHKLAVFLIDEELSDAGFY